MTRKAATIQGLLNLGYVETHRSRKYRTFEKDEATYMVGKSGALRFTRGPLSMSASKTGTKMHLAIAHVGEKVANLNQELCQEVLNRFLRGEITPC